MDLDEDRWPEPKQESELGDDDNDEEDSQDLDTSQQNQRVMLARLPEYLMTQLRGNHSDLSGADIGRVLMSPSNPQHLHIRLGNRHESLKLLPQEYNVTVTNPQVTNVFVLKEQERLRNNRKVKRTALAGHAVNECVMTADPNDPNYGYVLQHRKLMELPQADRQTTLLDSMAGVGGAKYGATLKQQKDSWRKPVLRRQLIRQATEGKAIRVPRNELLDMLFRAFEAQPYWTVKQLRERTRQPEMYLRSVLDSISVLVKRGPYAMRYGLKEEYKHLQSMGASVENLVEKAPQGPEPEDDKSESDMEMENVDV